MRILTAEAFDSQTVGGLLAVRNRAYGRWQPPLGKVDLRQLESNLRRQVLQPLPRLPVARPGCLSSHVVIIQSCSQESRQVSSL